MSNFKRRITVDQLKELTPDEQQKLIGLWKPQVGDTFVFDLLVHAVQCVYEHGEIICARDLDKYFKDHCIPLLDIGQMIEICDGKVDAFFNRNPGPTWSVTIGGIWIDKEQLCDALWAAVKEVLK